MKENAMHRSTLEVPHPSPLRIGAGSAVIAAHVALLLLMSLAVPEGFAPQAKKRPGPIEVIDIVVRAPAPPLPPPPPMPVAPSRPHAVVTQAPVQVRVPPMQSTLVAETVQFDPVVDGLADPGVLASESEGVLPGGFAGLALLHAPDPPYPARAKRLGWQGEVLLRIHVGSDGFPREVRIVRGSGHAELDRSARTHVLRHWRFVPPRREATGEVPIRFALY
jgi:protein TonB